MGLPLPIMVTRRRLIFYKWESIATKPPFEPTRALTELHDKIAGDPNFAILSSDDVTTGVNIVSSGSEHEPVKLQLLALRSEANRPSQWKPGEELAALSMPADWYPSDVSHVMIWPNGIAAQDLHANAPRLGRLSFYLRNQIYAYVTFEPLYQPGMFARLQQLRGRLRTVEISMTHPEYVPADRGAFGTLLPAVFGQRTPSVAARIGMGRRGPRDRFLDGATEEAVFRIAEDAHDQVDRLIVYGNNPVTNKTERVNLLSERLQERVELPTRTDAPGLPVLEAAFEALSAVYARFDSDGAFSEAVQARATRPR
jgi:hypothetical protein